MVGHSCRRGWREHHDRGDPYAGGELGQRRRGVQGTLLVFSFFFFFFTQILLEIWVENLSPNTLSYSCTDFINSLSAPRKCMVSCVWSCLLVCFFVSVFLCFFIYFICLFFGHWVLSWCWVFFSDCFLFGCSFFFSFAAILYDAHSGSILETTTRIVFLGGRNQRHPKRLRHASHSATFRRTWGDRS